MCKTPKKVLWSGSLNTMAKAVIRKTLIQICRPPKLMTMKAISYTISYAISYTISHCISHTISYKYTMSYTKMRYRIRYNNVYDIVYDIVYVLTKNLFRLPCQCRQSSALEGFSPLPSCILDTLPPHLLSILN